MISAASLGNSTRLEPDFCLNRQDIIEPIPRDGSQADAIAFYAVRLECWRYRYDARMGALCGERLLSASAEPRQ